MSSGMEELDIDILDDVQDVPLNNTSFPSSSKKYVKNQDQSEDVIQNSLTGSALDEAASVALSQSHPWHNDGGMDADTRAIIEQMLAEEELYFGKSSFEQKKSLKSREERKAKDPVKKELSDSSTERGEIASYYSSSAHMPSHNQKWTPEEDTLLFNAMKRHGIGKWRAIAQTLVTRTPLQVKNHARYILNSYKSSMGKTLGHEEAGNISLPDSNNAPSAVKTKRLLTSQAPTRSPAKARVKPVRPESIVAKMTLPRHNAEEDDDVDINIEDDWGTEGQQFAQNILSPISANVDISENKNVASEPSTNEDTITSPLVDDVTIYQPSVPDDRCIPPISETCERNTAVVDDVGSLPSELTSVGHSLNEDNVEHRHSNDVDTKLAPEDQGESEKQPPPTEERTMERDVISAEETIVHRSFFIGHHRKTPDRYLRIRNHMIDLWHKNKPRYLTKTAARQGLKDCGDVNAIGRVHEWLESIGAINFDADEESKKAARPRMEMDDDDATRSSRKHDELHRVAFSDATSELNQKRQRRVRDPLSGEWFYEHELEGHTIEHISASELHELAEQRRLEKLNARHFGDGNDSDDAGFGNGRKYSRPRKSYKESSFEYDPFKLISLRKYDAEKPAPFRVIVQSNALLMMDLHAHLAETEIIGLLGGEFDEELRILKVSSVFPCNSISTGLQCEMDPVSEMQARDHFSSMHQIVVGWYHSHPTFEPNPSIRDIENQAAYQSLFQLPSDVEPFIGVIVTPYDPYYAADQSIFQYLHVDHSWDESQTFRIPYQCEKEIVPSGKLSVPLFNEMIDLLQRYKNYQHREDLTKSFRIGSPTTKFEKLLRSLESNIYGVSEDDQLQFMAKFSQVFKALWGL